MSGEGKAEGGERLPFTFKLLSRQPPLNLRSPWRASIFGGGAAAGALAASLFSPLSPPYSKEGWVLLGEREREGHTAFIIILFLVSG